MLEHLLVAERSAVTALRARSVDASRPTDARLSTFAGPAEPSASEGERTRERFAPPSLPRRKERQGRIEVLFIVPAASARFRGVHLASAPLARATRERLLARREPGGPARCQGSCEHMDRDAFSTVSLAPAPFGESGDRTS